MSSAIVDQPLSRMAHGPDGAPQPASTAITISSGLTEHDQLQWDAFVHKRYQAASHREIDPAPAEASQGLAERLECGANFFQTTAWARAVESVFGHRFHGLQARMGNRLVGVLPLSEVHSWFARRPLLISLPYAVYGGVLAESEAAATALYAAARSLGEKTGCGQIELRCPVAPGSFGALIDGYVTFRGVLPGTAGDVLDSLPRKARAAARQARERYRLRVQFGDALLDDVWSLYSRSMRRLASINYPRAFFEELVRRTPGNHGVSVVFDGHRPIAGLLSFMFEDTFLPYFAGCDERYQHKQVNNFLYLTAMEQAVEMGKRVFDFGRTRLANRGAFEFKRNQGFQPTALQYQRLHLTDASAADLSPSRPLFAQGRRLWRWMPLTLTRPAGALLSRHIPG